MYHLLGYFYLLSPEIDVPEIGELFEEQHYCPADECGLRGYIRFVRNTFRSMQYMLQNYKAHAAFPHAPLTNFGTLFISPLPSTKDPSSSMLLIADNLPKRISRHVRTLLLSFMNQRKAHIPRNHFCHSRALWVESRDENLPIFGVVYLSELYGRHELCIFACVTGDVADLGA